MKDRIEVPAVVLCNPKYEHNVGGVLRACSCFGIQSLLWTGRRVRIEKERGQRLPREERMKGYKDVKWLNCDQPFGYALPGTVRGIAIELLENSEPLTYFDHFIESAPGEPSNVAYVFGPEDGSIPPGIRRLCHRFVHIPAYHCLNLAAAVNVVLADRMMKLQLAGIRPILPVGEMLHERRGYDTPVLDTMGWDGR